MMYMWEKYILAFHVEDMKIHIGVDKCKCIYMFPQISLAQGLSPHYESVVVKLYYSNWYPYHSLAFHEQEVKLKGLITVESELRQQNPKWFVIQHRDIPPGQQIMRVLLP